MLDITVISSDAGFAAALADACRDNENVRKDVAVKELKKMKPADFHGLKRSPALVLFVLDRRDGMEELRRLLQADDLRVVVVLRDDDPEMAFDLMTDGADYAIAVPMQGTASAPTAVEMLRQLLYPALAEIVAPEQRVYVKKKLTAADQVFVSMRYDNPYRNSREEHDYRQAIVPALKRLGVDVELSRARRNRHGRTTNAKLLAEIHGSRVILVQVSNMSSYVAYEFGAADSALRLRRAGWNGQPIALEEMIILRPLSAAMPSVAEGLDRLEYVNRTDLALKLFLGLRGTRADLQKGASARGARSK